MLRRKPRLRATLGPVQGQCWAALGLLLVSYWVFLPGALSFSGLHAFSVLEGPIAWGPGMAGLPSPPTGALRWGSVHWVFERCSRILLLTGRGTVLLRALQILQSGPSDPASPHLPQGDSSCFLLSFLVGESPSFWSWRSQRTRERHTVEGASGIKASGATAAQAVCTALRLCLTYEGELRHRGEAACPESSGSSSGLQAGRKGWSLEQEGEGARGRDWPWAAGRHSV